MKLIEGITLPLENFIRTILERGCLFCAPMQRSQYSPNLQVDTNDFIKWNGNDVFMLPITTMSRPLFMILIMFKILSRLPFVHLAPIGESSIKVKINWIITSITIVIRLERTVS